MVATKALASQGRPRPEERPYEPRGGALRVMYCTDDEVLLDGPAGTGKSRALLEKAHLCLLNYPGMRALGVRKTRKSMTTSALVTFEEKVLLPNDPLKSGAKRDHRSSYNYPNSSEFVIGGMDSGDKIMSTDYDLIVVFEATELVEDDWEKLTTRLRYGVMPYQQLAADCNPSFPHHWLNRRCNAGKTLRILSRHEDNPSVTESYLSKLRALTGARRARLYEGRWASQEGLVYDGFDAAVHVIDRMPKGWEHWKGWRAIDFGYTNPFVCQWWKEDPDGRLYLYREIYRTRRIVEDHAKDILSLSEGERYEDTLADHDAEDRATLNRHGVRTSPAPKSITPGIQAVQARLRLAGDGRPRIFFLASALVETDSELVEANKPYNTIQEFDAYVWPEGKDGKAEKEEPVDTDNHGMDAMRYLVYRLDAPRRKVERLSLPGSGNRAYVG